MALILIAGSALAADPVIAPGDAALRHDIQLLADAGILRGPVTTWPLAWTSILAELDRADAADWTPAEALAAARVQAQGQRESRRGRRHRAALSGAEEPLRWRSFANTPRESGELAAGLSWIGERFDVKLHGQVVASPEDGQEFRMDGSRLAAVIGNYSVAASTLDRWWGPGWDGSLILSSNARPIPALTFDRVLTDAFESRWLSWLGPWDVSAVFGQMEGQRSVPDTQFFGLRFNFRPLPSLEIGLSRTAQWCGEGRPCDLDTFVDLLLGRDNRGDEGIDTGNEPGNQLAGIDFRWTPGVSDRQITFYGQFIGEDEAGGFPSKFLGQAGIETSGLWRDHWSWRGFLELASTKCRFYQSGDDYDCAYNHGIYQTGYRYRGRAIGHGSDNDSLMLSTGLFLVGPDDSQWQLLARYGELNRGGMPDPRNTLTMTRQDLASLDLMHSRTFQYGVIDVGLGAERLDSDTDARAFIQWRTSR